ncbi:DUF1102 domain-containing protein [Halocatena pleomorpha]|uniref:DUF1102 domain-containing protein n=1 Tax=Halocatena pleomorpha TaxID=1785090 RepID=UPI0011CF64A4|nr:DUF1102 domain-containing protein [Halocatena pleomorpha]
MTTSRETSVDVVGDKAGYLGLTPGENGEYTTYQNGKLQLQLNGARKGEDAPSGSGVNHGAKTSIGGVVNITNQGTQSVGVWLQDTDDSIEFQRGNGDTLEGKGNAVTLTPGDTVRVGLAIDTTDTSAEDLSTQLTINAASDVGGTTAPRDKTGTSSSGQPATPPEDTSDDSQPQNDSGESTKDRGKDKMETTPSKDKKSEDFKAGTAVKATIEGALYGNAGMPGGLFNFTASEVSSPFYLLGQLINAFAPPAISVVSDLRDLGSNLADGKIVTIENVLIGLGLIPVVGNLQKVTELRKITTKWMDEFPSKADEAVSFLSNGLIKHLPSGVGAKLLGAVSDAPVKKLTKEKVPVDDIIKYQDENVNFDRVLELRSKGVSVEDIRFYVDEGINLGLVKQLRDEGMKPNRIRFRLGDGSKKSISTLRSQNYNRKEIVELIDMGADLKKASELSSQGFRKEEIKHFVDKGADLEKVSKLKSQRVPHSDINYYVDNDMWLGGVSMLQENGVPPDTTKNLITKINQMDELDKYPTKKQVEILNREISGWTVKRSTLEIAKAVVAHNSWEGARSDSQTKDKNNQGNKRSKALIQENIYHINRY